MIEPVYLYVFGSVGGPFKIGYSKDPSFRAKCIPKTYPGYYFVKGNAIMWWTSPLPDKAAARLAERRAHSMLWSHGVRVPDKSRLNDDHVPGTTEWFNVTLCHALKIASEAAKPSTHTADPGA